MKKLITHINPHLDDILAIWLFKKFNLKFADANLEFISASRDAAKEKESEDVIFFGTGGGKFDEHKEGSKESAGSLVWKQIRSQAKVKNELEEKALDELVEWNTLVDTGKAPAHEFGPFSLQAYIRPLDSSPESSKKAVELGSEILDRILEVLKRKYQSLKDWEKRVEFGTSLGKGVAVKSETVDRAFCKAQTGDIFLIYDPKYSSVQYFTPSFEIDLEPIYRKVKKLDPEADWFLHQSHHMVICGSGSAPDSKKTKLTFEQLIEIAKTV